MINSLKFFFRYRLYKQNLSVEVITKIIINQGFQIIEYNPTDRKDSGMLIIGELGLLDYLLYNKACTYIDSAHKYVFLLRGLTQSEQLILLYHEEAHIFCEHNFKQGLLNNSDVQKEDEAAHFLSRLKRYKYIQKVLIPMCALAAIVMIMMSPASTKTPDTVTSTPSELQITNTVYWADTGSVYHLYKNCSYLKNSVNIHSGTVDVSPVTRCCTRCRNKQKK